jgi:adenylylsulfate kinase-like enzyme
LGAKVEVLDGDVVRKYLSKDLGFSKEDRDDGSASKAFRSWTVCSLIPSR